MRRGLRVYGIIRGGGRQIVVRAHPSDPWAARLAQLDDRHAPRREADAAAAQPPRAAPIEPATREARTA